VKIQDVVKNHLCTGCGTCSGICPVNAIEIKETNDGRLLPSINLSVCNNCQLCNKVCPQIVQSERFINNIGESLTGQAVQGYLGKPVDESLFMEGQTSGLVRSLLMYALESGYADKVVCVGENKENPLRPIFNVYSTKSEIVNNIARSKYCPTNFGEAIKLISRIKGKYVVVGLGCQIQGLNAAMEKNYKLNERVILAIGLFCDRVLKYSAMDSLIRHSGLKSENVSSFDFKHKKWRGYPGDVRIIDNEGNQLNIDRKSRLRIWDIYSSVSCRICIDKLNIASDISVGDPWGIKTGADISSAVISRTSKGDAFLKNAQKSGIVTLQNCDVDAITRGQNISLRLNNCVSFKNMMQKKGFLLPVVFENELFSKTQIKASLINMLNFRFNLWTESPKGAEFLIHLPLWVIYAVAYFNIIIKFCRRVCNYIHSRAIRRFRRILKSE
jgi:coenzyme F420 hydrogenase subunit beta